MASPASHRPRMNDVAVVAFAATVLAFGCLRPRRKAGRGAGHRHRRQADAGPAAGLFRVAPPFRRGLASLVVLAVIAILPSLSMLIAMLVTSHTQRRYLIALCVPIVFRRATTR